MVRTTGASDICARRRQADGVREQRAVIQYLGTIVIHQDVSRHQDKGCNVLDEGGGEETNATSPTCRRKHKLIVQYK